MRYEKLIREIEANNISGATVLTERGAEALALLAGESKAQSTTDVVFTTGGLGPTADDMTLAAVARAASVPLEENAKASAFVRSKYKELAEKGYVNHEELTEERRKMAILPHGALPVTNPVGSAPGVVLRTRETTIICLPGVPAELKGIFTTSLQPVLQELFGESVFVKRMVLVDCGDESVLAPIIKSVAESHPSAYVKSRAEGFGPNVKLKITLSLAGRIKTRPIGPSVRRCMTWSKLWLQRASPSLRLSEQLENRSDYTGYLCPNDSAIACPQTRKT